MGAINQNIKFIRELSGLKQAHFAKLIKTNLSNLKTYENTEVRPKANVITAIALLAGIEPDQLDQKLTHRDIKIKVDKVENYLIKESQPADDEPDLKQIMRIQNALIQELAKHSHTQNVILAEIKEGIQDKVKAIDSNLKTALGGVEQLSLHVESARVVILDSLSRLEKRPGSLKDEADRIVVRLMKERSKQGNVAASGR